MAYGNYMEDNPNKGTAFMVRKTDAKGKPYWSGYCDFGNGTAVKLTMFEQNKKSKEGRELKSEFSVQVNKKSYDPNKSNADRWNGGRRR